jgi:phosphatidylglycerol:prolipoprotein diacylglycerol transferase
VHEILAITWTVDPVAFELPILDRGVRWYGILFATAFLIAYYFMDKMLKAEDKPAKWMDSLLLYMMVGTVLGARLGHVFFYDWDYYSQNPGDILAVWKGGLASHGATIGILLACWLFARKVKHPAMYFFDRISLVAAASAAFIRFGNLTNHEIIGNPSDAPWGFIFTLANVPDPMIPRHPAQLYEAICYLIIFGLMNFLYWKKDWGKRNGALMGFFLISLFTARFFIEFVKNSQGGFESSLGDVLSTGQWLSIPFVILGIYLLLRSRKNVGKVSPTS